jgi:hypothetical protein
MSDNYHDFITKELDKNFVDNFKKIFIHKTPKDTCDHDFQGCYPYNGENGSHGGEAICTKCGLGAIAYSLRTGI